MPCFSSVPATAPMNMMKALQRDLRCDYPSSNYEYRATSSKLASSHPDCGWHAAFLSSVHVNGGVRNIRASWSLCRLYGGDDHALSYPNRHASRFDGYRQLGRCECQQLSAAVFFSGWR